MLPLCKGHRGTVAVDLEHHLHNRSKLKVLVLQILLLAARETSQMVLDVSTGSQHVSACSKDVFKQYRCCFRRSSYRYGRVIESMQILTNAGPHKH